MNNYKLIITHPKAETVWKHNLENQEKSAKLAEQVFDLITGHHVGYGAMALCMAMQGLIQSSEFTEAFERAQTLMESGMDIGAMTIKVVEKNKNDHLN